MAVFPNMPAATAREIKPGLRVKRVAVSRVPVFIQPCRDTSILVRGGRCETVEDDPVLVGPVFQLGHGPPRIRPFIDIDLNRSGQRFQMFARVVEMVPRRWVLQTAHQRGFLSFEMKLSAVMGMFSGHKDTRAFVALGCAELLGFLSS